MNLKVLASGSKANSYILENENEALVIEAGVPFKELIRHVDHRKIVGCLVSHEHKDHAAFTGQYQMRGILTFTPYTLNPNRAGMAYCEFKEFKVMFFENHHDVPCYGFIITHPEMGKMIFATDTGHIDYRFKDVNHWMIECNNSKEILDQRVKEGYNPSLAYRIVKDHHSLDTCKQFFSSNDLSKTRNIVLLHLSDTNSNADQFQKEIHELTKKDIFIADKGLIVDLSLCPL